MIRFIQQNLRYKILALACAWGLYMMYGRADVNPLTYGAVRAQVRPINVPPGLEISSIPVVTIGLRAPKRMMTAMLNRADGGTADVDAMVDLRGKGAGPHTIPVRVAVKTPLVSLAGEVPLITVKLEPNVEKRFPVEFVPQGSVPAGYRLDTASVVPRTAQVQGPRSAVDQVTRLEVRVPVRHATADVQRDEEIHAVDSRDEPVKQVHIFPAQARAAMQISRALQYKVVPIVLQTTGSPAKGFHIATLQVEPVVTTLSGSNSALAEVQAVSTEPVDLSGATATVVRRVRLRPPEGIQTVSASAVRVKIYLINDNSDTGDAGHNSDSSVNTEVQTNP